MNKLMIHLASVLSTLALAACGTVAPVRPSAWSSPEALVAPSQFGGVHGLAFDKQGRLLAGSVVGYSMWEVDRRTGQGRVLIGAPEGQADDIAIGPNGELAWTNYLMGMVRMRESDGAPMKVLAKDLPGLNSLDFDRRNGKLYASQVFLGDALWELDARGSAPPRLIAKDLGGFNGFEVGPDGMLYGPLWFKGQVVKIDPANGRVTVINSDFKTPAAANLDGKGNLWVIDTRTGELCRVDLATGIKSVARQLKPSLDNLAISQDGMIYVSNMADNSIEEYNPGNGQLRTLTSGKLAVPAGMKMDGPDLYIADVFSFRRVDSRSGTVQDIFRMQASDMEYPSAVGLSSKQIALSAWFTGSVQVIDRATMKTDTMLHGLKAPTDAIPLIDGGLLIIEAGTGTLTLASGPKYAQRKPVADGLTGPVQMALGRDGAVYITEAAGKLTRVNVGNGNKTTVADGLAMPEGLAQTPWGTWIVAESLSRRLTEIDPGTGTRRTVAENLPIGLPPGPGMPPFNMPTGVAVGPDGVVYVSADRNNALYRIRPMK